MKFLFITFICLHVCWGSTAEASGSQKVTFRYLAPAGTQTVALTGNFNEWSASATPMADSDGDGYWEVALQLNSGTWEYRFLVDGKHWMRDPLNPEFGGGHSNSICRVNPPGQPKISRIYPAPGGCVKNSDFTATIWLTGSAPIDSRLTIDGQAHPLKFFPSPPRLSASIEKLHDGIHRLNFQITDRAGQTRDEVDHYFLVNAQDLPPVAHAGFSRNVAVNEKFSLNAGLSFDSDFDPIEFYQWKSIGAPENFAPDSCANSPFPEIVLPAEGRYLFSLQVTAGGVTSQVDSVAIFAFWQQPKLTDFIFNSSQFPKPVAQVNLAGEFNRWTPGGTALRKTQDSLWQIQLPLANGEYEYKFVVNETDWLPDPQNPARVSDGWQGVNSVKSVHFPEIPLPAVALEQLAATRWLRSRAAEFPAKKFFVQWLPELPFPVEVTAEKNDTLLLPETVPPGQYFFQTVNRGEFDFSAPQNYYLKSTGESLALVNWSASPEWCRDAIIYEIFVRKFTEKGNLEGVRQKLDYLSDLGINCIWLMPVFESPTEHGYGPGDFFQIEPDYGTLEDFRKLIRAAHQQGICVVLDFIANHTSDQHPYFRAAFQNSKSVFRNWYHWRDDTLRADGLIHGFHNDWDTLPNLNYENPQVWNFMLEVARFWQNEGVDGFRCDVAWGVPHPFWKTFRRAVKATNPECLLLNEVLPRSPVYHQDEFDMSYDTDFYGNLLDVLQGKKEVAALDYGLRKTFKNYPPNALSLRYLENHDMERFIRQFGAARTRLAAALLLTYPGTPLLLYGQEIGLQESTGQMRWDAANPDLFKFYQLFIQLRRGHPALRSDEILRIPTENPWVYAYLRRAPSETFLIGLNFSGDSVNCSIELPPDLIQFDGPKSPNLVDVISKTTRKLTTHRFDLKLAPFQPLIFEILEP